MHAVHGVLRRSAERGLITVCISRGEKGVKAALPIFISSLNAFESAGVRREVFRAR